MKIKCVKYTLQLYALSALQARSIPKYMLQKWDESIVASFAGCKECSPFLLMREGCSVFSHLSALKPKLLHFRKCPNLCVDTRMCLLRIELHYFSLSSWHCRRRWVSVADALPFSQAEVSSEQVPQRAIIPSNSALSRNDAVVWEASSLSSAEVLQLLLLCSNGWILHKKFHSDITKRFSCSCSGQHLESFSNLSVPLFISVFHGKMRAAASWTI